MRKIQQKGLVGEIIEALDLKPGDRVTVSTPKFGREDGKKIRYVPMKWEQFDALKVAPKDTLQMLGLKEWGEYSLWLFPCEWYATIPEGYEVTTITGGVERFKPGVTDDDRRYGVLAYGIVRPDLD